MLYSNVRIINGKCETYADINEGSSTGAVNFPEVSLRSITIEEENHARVCVVHHNMAGALREFNNIFSEVDINVDKQFSDSRYASLVPVSQSYFLLFVY